LIGLMSGTSADAIDGALLEVGPADDAGVPAVHLVGSTTVPWGPLTAKMLHLAMAGRAVAPQVGSLRYEVTEGFADCVHALLDATGAEPGEIDAVGCHGQTIWHRPPAHETPGWSLQLLDPARLAAETGIPVVSDFRSADLAAGGQGAPLVAFSDPILFAAPDRTRALLNWGGIANVTRLPAASASLPPLAFDLGPANALLDAAVEIATGGAARVDLDGAMAAEGAVDEDLLRDLLADPWFDLAPPRSTGKERFGAPFVERLAKERGLDSGSPAAGWSDFLRTLAEFTIRTTAHGIRRFVGEVDEVLVGGGGARNPVLMRGLAEEMASVPVRPLEVGDGPSGVDAETREAAAFALLAWAFLTGRPGNVPVATGAAGARVLGSFTPSPGRCFRLDFGADDPGGAPR
jgi:anhydro-N-acetylmuramic acid kinase